MGFREIVKGIGNCISGKYDQEVIDKVIFWDKDKQTGNEVYLQEIERIEELCGENEKKKIENVKRNVLKGIEGERQTKRKLGYCDFYCNILHDIKLSDGDLENQIDFLVITKKMCFIIECKNRSGKVKILKDGRFSIGTYRNGEWKSEKIVSPVEQNNEHVQLVKNIYKRNLKESYRILQRKVPNEYFVPILVWVNNSSKIDEREASEDVKAELKEQFVYLERLVTFMNHIYYESSLPEKSEKEVERISEIFYDIHMENEEKYQNLNRHRALKTVLRELEDVDPQELLKRELEHYRNSDSVKKILNRAGVRLEYRENFLNEEMIGQIIEIMPTDVWELQKKIHNSGKYTREKFGDDIIEILDRYRDIIE